MRFSSDVAIKLVVLYIFMILLYVAYRLIKLVFILCPDIKRRKKQSLLEKAGRSNNFYLEIRIDVLEELYYEVIYQIQMRQKIQFPIKRLNQMNRYRLEHEPSFEHKDPTKFHLDYLASKKQQIEKAIDNHMAFVDHSGELKNHNYF